MNIYVAIGSIILAGLIFYYGTTVGSNSERLKAQQAVIEQREDDAKILEKLEKVNVSLKQKVKKSARALRKSKDSSGCAVVNYPVDRRDRMQQSLREIRQGDGSN